MPQKNIPRFIAAIGKVVNDGYKIHVDWFGQDLKDAYSEECHNAIISHQLEGVFVFQEPSSNIQEEYCRADVFCLPSLYEGFPNVLCEAMSCGKPVLCSRVCDNPNIINENNSGLLFDPQDSTDVARVIECYLSFSSEKKESMARIGREIAVGLFSEKTFINNYLELL